MEERSAEIFQNAPQRDKEIKYIEKNRWKDKDEWKEPTYVS